MHLDSSRAQEVFSDAEAKYNALQQQLQSPSSTTQYLPYLDTLTTYFRFLEHHRELLGKMKNLESRFSAPSNTLKSFQGSLAKAEEIKAFVRERRQYLQQRLQGLPFTGHLRKLSRQAYYYSAQVNEYKQALKDKSKWERKAIDLLSNSRPFQNFMKRNSRLASLFPVADVDNLATPASLQGLQTRASINSLIQERVGTGMNAQALFRQNLQGAQAQLSQLEEKVAGYASGNVENSSSDLEVPDFQPNGQKTKSFLKRLEYGANVQSEKSTQLFPVTSDIALSLGYKLNDKSTIGIGASYKLGLGRGWNNIKLSNEGVGFRSFIDWKLKGSIYVSGGYEQNYRTAFHSLEQLRGLSGWQNSGLIGLSKRYAISKKVRGNVQLLWDFLSYSQVPQSQAVLFRVRYTLR